METNAQSAAKIPRTPANRDKGRKPKSLSSRPRTLAKMGMVGSLGALFVSGFFKFRGAKSLHIYSGLGLLAFTVWHHALNQPKAKIKRSSRLDS